MPELSPEQIKSYRGITYCSEPGLRVHSEIAAIEFVNQRGFIFFWPIQSDPFPSLWTAVAGNRPVSDDHDDPGHICWGWKDAILGTGKWYYGKLLRRRNTIISLELLPYFYALSPNYGDPETDYLDDYREGRLSNDAKVLYQALLQEGPLNTLDLRRKARLMERSSQSRFSKALDELQMTMRIIPVGISNAGPWHYAFLYDIVPRHFPKLIQQAEPIAENEAFSKLARSFFLSQGAASSTAMARLFHWDDRILDQVVSKLVEEGFLMDNVELPGSNEKYLAIPSLLNSPSRQSTIFAK